MAYNADAMKSPFPGMDPYLEDPAFWPDFHRTFINYLREALLATLPREYDARIDEQLRLVNYSDPAVRTIYPDVSIVRHPPLGQRLPRPQMPPHGVATLEPVTIPIPARAEVRDVWIEIHRLPDHSVVTVIELLSPANKRGDGFWEHTAKRQTILDRRVSLVEIDLLIGGRQLDFGPEMPRSDYGTYVTRPDRDFMDVYAWGLRDPLPAISIPLQTPDPDVKVDLSAVVHQAYERGQFERRLQYQSPPPAALNDEDAAWVRDTLQSHAPNP